ncbi:MAG: fibronectin type III domain-containing protein [Candidatus Aureabacteria bacterium]|nr:fibronectin type III domain-containing protein [Candidatus Auribacterota bacterium]
MKRVLRRIIYATIIVGAGCAGPQFYVLQGPPKYAVSLRSVNYEREIYNNDWKALVDVASDRAGNIFILDASTHQVFAADSQGKPLFVIGETGFWSKTFPRPSGLAVDSEGRIHVSDTKNDNVQIFDRTGAFSSRIGEKGVDAGNFRAPAGIDVDGMRNLYVIDQGNNRFQKFDPRGVFVMQIVSGPKPIEKINISRTSGPIKYISWPQFKRLRDVAVGPDGTIYLIDEGLCIVHAYSPQGAYLFSFGGRGKRGGKFEKPGGIAVGAMGVVCVTDEKNNTLQLFDPEGRFLTSVGSKGKGHGQFSQPQGVGTSADGRIFIADKGNRRVQIFSYAIPRPEVTVARIEKPVRIAVFDFKNNNPAAQSRGYGEAISDMFITAFAKQPNFEVIERKQVRKVIDEIYFDQSGVVESETAKKIGKILGIDVALAGGVAAFANSIEIDLRLLDVETGRVILADSLKANFEHELRPLVNREVLRLENSYVVRFCPPAPPVGLKIEAGIRRNILSWSANEEPDFKEYRIYRAESAEGPYALLGKTRETEWVDKNLSDGASYYYRLAAADTTKMESKQCPEMAGTTRPRPALGQLPVKENVAVKKSSFSWSENENDVTGYVIYRSASADGEFKSIGESRTPRFSEGGFGDGETYYYKVAKKYRNGLDSEPSKPFAVSTKPHPSIPEGFTAQSGLARRVYLEWGNPKESDIREFRLYRSRSEDGDYKRIATVKPGWLSSPSYTDGGLEDKAEYYYKLQSIDKDDLSSQMSPPVKATTKPVPSTPRGLAASGNKARAAPLSWEKNPETDIKKYTIFSAEKEGGPFRQLAETPQNEFIHKGLKDLTTYSYKIKAVDRDDLVSDFSQPVSATTKPCPTKPRELSAESGLARSARLTWAANPEGDIDHYVVSRKTGRGGSFKDVGSSKSNSYLDERLENGARYQYNVRAVDADGLESDASDKTEASTKPRPAAPEGVTAEAQNGKIVLTWKANPEPDISGYEIYRSTAWDILGGESRVGQVTGLRFEDCTAQAKKKYTYRIAAVDGVGLHSEKSKAASAHLP